MFQLLYKYVQWQLVPQTIYKCRMLCSEIQVAKLIITCIYWTLTIGSRLFLIKKVKPLKILKNANQKCELSNQKNAIPFCGRKKAYAGAALTSCPLNIPILAEASGNSSFVNRKHFSSSPVNLSKLYESFEDFKQNMCGKFIHICKR